MVTIRKLRPTIKIAMPSTPKEGSKHTHCQKMTIRRTLRDFPAPTPLDTPCRLWQGATSVDGYGMHYPATRHSDSKEKIGMHRWVMEMALGRKLARTEFVMHLCDHRLCYRFDHLMIGSVQDNNADMFAKKRNVKPPIVRKQGTRHHAAKLNDDLVLEMRRRRIAGASLQELADAFGIHPAQCSKIVRGKLWTHLPTDPENPNV